MDTSLLGGHIPWKYADRHGIARREASGDASSVPASKVDLADIGVALVGLYAVLFGLWLDQWQSRRRLLGCSIRSRLSCDSLMNEALASRRLAQTSRITWFSQPLKSIASNRQLVENRSLHVEAR